MNLFTRAEDGVKDTSVLGGVMSVLSIVLVNISVHLMNFSFACAQACTRFCSKQHVTCNNDGGGGAV